MGKLYQVILKGIRGKKVTIGLCNTEEQMKSMTVLQLKEKNAQKLPYTAAAESRSTNSTSHPKTSSRMSKIYQVMVSGIRGKKVTISLCNTEEQMKSMTVLQLKEKIAQKLPYTAGYFEKDRLQLIFTDKILDEDSSFLSKYGIQHIPVNHKVAQVPQGAEGGPLPSKGNGGMGDKDDKHRWSMEKLVMM